MNVLVTGITGYVGSRLVPRLRATATPCAASPASPTRVELEFPVVRGDAVSGEGLPQAFEGIDVAYFLIHSMEPSPTIPHFPDRERRAAENFARRCQGGGHRPDCLPGRARCPAASRRRSTRVPARGRADPAGGLAVLGRAAGLDRDRRRLSLFSVSGAAGGAPSCARDSGLAHQPHAPHRRTGHDRTAGTGSHQRCALRPVARCRRPATPSPTGS